MQAFVDALVQAGQVAGIEIPPAFLYQGGNPSTVRRWIIDRLEEGASSGYEFVMVSLTINLFGTRLVKDSSGHKKFNKQGEGTKAMVLAAHTVIQKHLRLDAPWRYTQQYRFALPELSLLAMVADNSKPAPGCAQLAFSKDLKLGLLNHTPKV